MQAKSTKTPDERKHRSALVKKQVYVCEVCGKTLFGVPIIVEIAGHHATTCPSCARRIRGEQLKLLEKAKSQVPTTKQTPKIEKVRKTAKPKPRMIERQPKEYEIVEDFGKRIKKAREELGLKIEHIAKAINIKTSTLSKIEAGKIVPNYDVARSLERVLDIRIITRESYEAISTGVEKVGPPPSITLGELANLKEKKRRE